MFTKKTKTKFILSLLLVGLFAVALNTGYSLEKPIFNDHSKDRETLKLANETTSTTWSTSPISAKSGDTVAFNVYYHNKVEETTAKNTKISIDYPSTEKTQINVEAEISADNASSVFDTGRININGSPQRLEFEELAYWYPNKWETGDDYKKIEVKQIGSSKVEVDIGDIKGCWEYQGHVVFYAKLVEEEEKDSWGDLTCYSETKNSITLSYDAENVTNASIFRGSTRIRTVGSGNVFGTYRDTGLSPDTSYVYYLRDGRYTSSDRLARVVCSTDYEEEKEEELVVTKRVKSLDRNIGYTSSLSALPGESLNYSVRIDAEKEDARDVIVKDTMPGEKIKYDGNLRVDGVRVSGNIENGIDIGDISKGDYKTVTFDAKVTQREDFLIGTTSITNVARATSKNATDTGKATVHVTRKRPTAPPTEVPTGITGNGIVDYILLPLLLAMTILFLFRKQFSGLAKRIENVSREVRADWHLPR